MAATHGPGRPEERARNAATQQEKLQAMQAQLADQVRNLRTAEDWTAWLRLASRLQHYSFNNVLLILAQCPDASTVAGYRAWQNLGRQVEKGERGIQILAPVLRRPDPADAKDLERKDDEVATTRRVVGYRVTHVWDVSQTSGERLPEQPRPQLMTGQAPEGLWDDLAAQVQSLGFALSRAECEDANGLTDFASRTVRVRSDVDDAQAVKTLAHELGHVLLHDTGPRVRCRGVVEVEAESVAFLVTASQGLASDGYTFPYVLGWASGVDGAQPEDLVARVGQRVVQAAGQVIGALDRPDKEALADVAARTHGARVKANRILADAESTAAKAARPTRDQLLAVHADAMDFFERHRSASWVDEYLAGRGLGAAGAPEAAWRIGHAPASWTALIDHLREIGYSDPTLEGSGLVMHARTGRLVDRFRDRLMLAIRDADGDVVGFVGRSAPGADERTPKYLNSATTAVYRKGETLFGLAEAIEPLRAGATPVLTEGPLDAIAVSVAAAPDRVGLALCGTATSTEQAGLLTQHGLSADVVVALDADAAGMLATEKAYDHLRAAGLRPYLSDLPPGIDPAELLCAHGAVRLKAVVTTRVQPFVDVLVDRRIAEFADRLKWVEGKVAAVRSVASLIADTDPMHRQWLIRRTLDLTGVSREVITLELRRHQEHARRSTAIPGVSCRGSGHVQGQPGAAVTRSGTAQRAVTPIRRRP